MLLTSVDFWNALSEVADLWIEARNMAAEKRDGAEEVKEGGG